MNIFVKNYFKFGSVAHEMLLKDFLFFSFGGHFTQQTKTVCAIYAEEHFCEFGFWICGFTSQSTFMVMLRIKNYYMTLYLWHITVCIRTLD